MAILNEDRQTLRFKGLTSAEVEENRRKHGENILTPPKRFDDPVIRILIIAAIIAIGVGIIDGKYAEGVGIVIAIMLATTLAFINEYKANREFYILNKVNDEAPIQVVRDGHFTTVPKKDLVFNDIILVELGEEIPADGQILEAVSLQVDEASLTGESEPVRKVAKEQAKEQSGEGLAYPADRLLRGTIVDDGHGTFEVTAVGDSTEIGKTARTAAEEETEQKTPLNIQLERLSKLIGVVAFGVAGLIFIALVTRGVIAGYLQLTWQQWYFAGILAAGVLVTLIRVWLPIVYDAFELIGKDIKQPSWLEKGGLVRWLATIGIGLVIFCIGFGIGYVLDIIPQSAGDLLPREVSREFLKYFMIAIAIIVVAVPEGLAMSVTLSLAYSMRKMRAANNLVRRMHACETIGAATVICTDTTGTLTQNEMRVYEVNFPSIDSQSIKKDAKNLGEKLIVEAISANSTANLERNPGETTRPLGNPTEGALLLWLDEQGLDYVYHRANFPITYQWTFSTERKYMATLGISPASGDRILHVKGAPEIVLSRCSKVLTSQDVETLNGYRATIMDGLKDYQARGMRTLAFAYHEAPGDHEGADIEKLANDMTWLGFVAIADPIRTDVPDAIQACRDAGIMVKVVTGGNPQTAQEISRQIQLWEDGDTDDLHIMGQDFSSLLDEEAKKCAAKLKILSRACPMHKLQLVKHLQDQGQVVAVTGDGTGDAPALNYANVGLAMGKTGTSIAKEASDIILLDDSFSSIVSAVMWGRSLYENIQRFILFQLTINVAALGIAFLGPFIGIKLPLTVTQMLWVNLIMDTFAALALASEPPHWSVMKRPPRDPEAFIVSKTMAKNILSVASIFLVFLVGFLIYLQKDGPVTSDEPTRKLTLFFSVFVLLQFWNLFNARCLGQNHSAFSRIWENKGFVIIASTIFLGQIWIIQLGGTVFRTVPLTLQDWIIILAGTSVVLWVGELWRLSSRIREVHR